MSGPQPRRTIRNPASAEHDLPPFAGQGIDYLICSTQRSGSTLLCYLLNSCGLMGVPHEYLHPKSYMPALAERFGVAVPGRPLNMERYLAALRQRRTTANGVFGMKAHYHQLEPFMRAKPIGRFIEGARLIRIHRRDLLAQAISLYRAMATNNWANVQVRSDEPPPEPDYDGAAIMKCLDRIVREDVCFRMLFAVRGLDAFEVWYEDLVANPDGICRSLCRYVGVQTDHVFALDAVDIRPNAAARTKEWKERFRAEHRISGAA